jgi:hypothetical protein
VTNVESFLQTVAGYTRAQTDGSADKACRIATIDPAYTTGNPKVTFEGESTMSAKGYPFLSSYTPVATERVVLVPVGTTYLIMGKIDNGVRSIATLLDALPKGLIGRKRSANNATTSTSGSNPLKDTDVGDLTFTAVSGRNYRIRFDAGWRADTATATMDVTVRDGNGSSPTSASTAIAGSSAFIAAATGAGRTNFPVERTVSCPGDISAGTHIVAAFYARITGAAGSVVYLQESANIHRELAVYDEGTQSV